MKSCCTFLLLLYFLANLAKSMPQGKNDVQIYDECVTKECVAHSQRLFENMNLKADPCEDFDEFACGNFRHTNVIAEDRGDLNSFISVTEEVYIRGRRLLKEEPKVKSAFIADQLMRDYYKACMNVEEIEEQGLEPAKKLLKEIKGWPVLEGTNWNPEGYKWYDAVIRMNKIGLDIDYIFKLEIITDFQNNSWRAVHLDQPVLGMDREYLINGIEDKDVQYYYDFMVESAMLMGAEEDRAIEEMRESLLFEIALANISAPVDERRNFEGLYNPTTLGQIGPFPGFPPSLKDYINKLFVTGDAPEIKVDDDEKVILTNLSFNAKLSDLLAKTPSQVIANYLGWRVLKSRIPYLNREAISLLEEYEKKLLDKEKTKRRWKQCVKETGFDTYTTASFAGAAGSLYVRRYFKPEDKEVMDEMIVYVKLAIKSLLEKNDWMDDKTRKKALYKLSTMRQFIAYPEQMVDPYEMNKRHEGLKVNSTAYFENVLAMSRFWRQKNYKELREKIDLDHWTQHQVVATVNAFNDPFTNTIKFAAGILQGAFFKPKAPKYANFGSIGALIGHVFTHGFDEVGRKFDYSGLLKDWWDEETGTNYASKAECIINQYGNYTAKQIALKLNGINTKDENIADNGGIKAAYSAYNDYVLVNGPEQKLVGHDFTPKQLFWISYSQPWCSKYGDGSLKNQILTGVHSPEEFRIIGPLSNMEEFAIDFNCPRGSPMNPEKKCYVW